MSATIEAERAVRTEIDVTADTVVALIADGVLHGDNATVSRAADAVGLMAGEVYAAMARRKERGWMPPRRVDMATPAAAPAVPVQTLAEQRPANRASFARANPAPGMRRCCRCKIVKPVEQFNIRNKQTGNRASMCKPCAKDYARERYLSVNQVKNLNAVGLTFKIGDADDVAGVTCIDCGRPIRVHEQVHGAAELRHTTCPTG